MSPCPRSVWIAVVLLSYLSLAPAAPTSRPLELTVDATDAPRGIFHARIIIPASPGPLVLAYPKWIQGEHGPSGPITQLAGLSITARGMTIPWRRDPLDMFLFHVDVPSGADSVSVDLDYLSPVGELRRRLWRNPECHTARGDRRLAQPRALPDGNYDRRDADTCTPALTGRLAA